MSEAFLAENGDLRLDLLPALPQARLIRTIAPRLWHDERVQALWLGGSIGAGTADLYSDVDLRVAVSPEDLAGWNVIDFDALLDDPPLARHITRLEEGSFIHHVIASSGDALDLLVQTVTAAPIPELTLLLGCRDEEFSRQLAAENHEPAPLRGEPATGELVRDLLVNFWIHSHNHRKVLSRHLELMFPAAAYANWSMVMRLWYISATGNDVVPAHFSSIHGLTPLTLAAESVSGPDPLALCGAPTRGRAEIFAAIERYRDIVSQLGHSLADRYGFTYPAELEEMTRREWAAFLAVVSG